MEVGYPVTPGNSKVSMLGLKEHDEKNHGEVGGGIWEEQSCGKYSNSWLCAAMLTSSLCPLCYHLQFLNAINALLQVHVCWGSNTIGKKLDSVICMSTKGVMFWGTATPCILYG